MASSATPKRPVENGEAVRDEWVAAVEGLCRDVEGWAVKQDWAVKREAKTVTEDRLGSYTVPRLLVHAPFGRMVLDPITRFVVGAGGLVEFCELPSYDSYLIARPLEGGNWFVQSPDTTGTRRPWNEQTFLDTVRSFDIARQ